MKALMGKAVYAILLLVVLALVKVVSKPIMKALVNSSQELTYDDSLKLYMKSFDQVKESFNKLPLKVDEMTTLDSVNVSKIENSFHYFYTVSQLKEEVDVDIFYALLKPNIDSSVKKNDKMELNRKFRTKLIYSYFDKNGKFLTEIIATY